MKKYLILLFVLIALLSACSKNRYRANMTPEEKLQIADSLYSAGKFSRAAVLYDEISFERRSASSAHALIRLAESYMSVNRWADARLRLEQFIRTFPENTRISDAYYFTGLTYFEESLPAQYDQALTLSAIDAFRTFIRRYPNDQRYQDALEYVRLAQSKLIEKRYRNGYIYYKMGDYSAALMYFNEVIELGNTNNVDKLSLYYSAKLHLHQGSQELAQESYNRLAEKYPDSKEHRKLRRYFD